MLFDGNQCYLEKDYSMMDTGMAVTDDPYICRVNSLWEAHDNCSNSAMKQEWKSKIRQLDRLHSQRLLSGDKEE